MIGLSNARQAHILGTVVVFCSAINGCDTKVDSRRTNRAVAVETALITQGKILLKRSFSGTLEATAKLIVSPKVAGRILTLHRDLGDAVKRGQEVIELDDDEYRQQVTTRFWYRRRGGRSNATRSDRNRRSNRRNTNNAVADSRGLLAYTYEVAEG